MSVWQAKNSLSDSTTSATLADSATSCNAVDGVAVPNSMETQALTTFVNEACDSTEVRGAYYARQPQLKTDGGEVADLKRYFSRPYAFYTGTFNQVTRTQMMAQNFSLAFIESIPGWYTRLSGMFGARFKIVFRLQIAAQPFHAGRIRMVWVPQYSSRANYSTLTTTSNGVSMLPGVEVDINESTSAVLEIPWVHTQNYLPVNGPSMDMGQMSLFSYLPVAMASGGVAPTYTIWIHLEDMEFISASPPLSSITNVTPAMAMPGETLGQNESALWRAGRVVLAHLVPMINSFEFKPSWALRTAANIASAFGWSKPTSSAISRMIHTQNTFQHNSDGLDLHYNLGTFSDNAIAPLSGFAGSQLDEMALSFLLTQWSCICVGGLLQADYAGQTKYSCILSPWSMWFNNTWNHPFTPTNATGTTPPPAQTLLTSPVFFLSLNFTRWKGSFEFRVKFAKTKFHTGRVLVGFIPLDPGILVSPYTTTKTVGLSNLDYQSEIWDLRQGNTFTFSVPYTSRYEYLRVSDNFGVFNMVILDPLAAPTTVSPTVAFAVEVRCKPDFEFASPYGPLCMPAPYTPVNIVAAMALPALESNRSAELCIGERVLSLKQLLTKACVTGSLSSAGGWASFTSWLLDVPSSYSGGAAFPPNSAYTNYLTCMYVYGRGGTIFDVSGPLSVSGSVVITTPGEINAFRAASSSCSQPYILEVTGNSHVKLPYNSSTPSVLLAATSNTFYTTPNLQIYMYYNADAFGHLLTVYMRACDDCQLGYFIGTPPIDTSTYFTGDITLLSPSYLSPS
jgi:hypothetical protein